MFVPDHPCSIQPSQGVAQSHSATPVISCSIAMQVSAPGSVFYLQAAFSAPSERIAFFGPSGSGKSLTLMALAGLLRPDQGHIIVRERTFFDSESKVNIPARRRKIGMLFQDYALFPHLTVRENVGFGLKPVFGPLKSEQRYKIEDLLDLCGLADHAAKRPAQISGGQRQRTALARALATEPDLLLLDEPFTALDQPLREKMREEVFALLERFALPMIMVSHDLADVEYFAQTLVAFGHGQVLDVIDYATRRRTESPQDILDPLFQAAQAGPCCRRLHNEHS